MRVTKKDMIAEYDYIMGYTIPEIKRDLQVSYPRVLESLLFKLSFINAYPKEEWKVQEVKSYLEHLKNIVESCRIY